MASKSSASADSTAKGAPLRRLSAAAAQAGARAEAAKQQVRVAKRQLKMARKAAKAAKKAARQARRQVQDAKQQIQAARALAKAAKAAPAKVAAPRKRMMRTPRLHLAAEVARSVIKRLNAARAVPMSSSAAEVHTLPPVVPPAPADAAA
jgi:hypothetical protein